MNTSQVARALGWFSIGLGVAELLAPRRVEKMIGVEDQDLTVQALGAREIISGVGLLARPESKGWRWSRVAGDLMDLSLLGLALYSARKADRSRLMATTAAVAGVTVVDIICSRKAGSNGHALDGRGKGCILVKKTITINRSPEEVYGFWRNFENLSRIMFHLESVRVLDEKRSHWVAKAPKGTVEWDAEIIEDYPNELIAWRSLPGADVENSGVVRFERALDGRGTIVRVELKYIPPAGRLGAKIARLFGEAPEQQVADDLRHLKQLLETGEIPTTEGQPSGRHSSISSRFDRFLKQWTSA